MEDQDRLKHLLHSYVLEEAKRRMSIVPGSRKGSMNLRGSHYNVQHAENFKLNAFRASFAMEVENGAARPANVRFFDVWFLVRNS